MSVLQIVWFFIFGILLAGYAILDGFDLGVGFWYLFAKKAKDRRALLKIITPFWDGNEVWLLSAGGVLFGAFPHVYATVFSGFYLALMLVLYALIFRAVSIEFRNKNTSPTWLNVWDKSFAIGSILAALLFSVAIGNILRGLPLDDGMNFTGSFFTLLNPYSLLIGLLGLLMIAMHGALYIAMKTGDDLQAKARDWAKNSWYAYLSLFILASIITMISKPHLLENYKDAPVLWLIPIITMVVIVMSGIFNKKGESIKSFIASSLSIAGMLGMVGAGLFPYLVPSVDNPDHGLTIMNASSSSLTLKAMLIITIIGMPFVIGYTIWIYRLFSGKVKEETLSY